MERTIEQQIADLEKQKQQLEKDKLNSIRDKKIAVNRAVVGKYFKLCSSYKYRERVGNNHITYVKVVDHVRYNDGKIMYGEDSDHLVAEFLKIDYSPVGWKLIQVGNTSRLAFVSGTNSLCMDLKKHYKEGISTIGSRYDYSYFYPKEWWPETKTVVDSSDNRYIECSKEEFYDAYNEVLNYANGFYHTAHKYFKTGQYITENTHASEEMVADITPAMIQRVSDLIAHTDATGITLNKMALELAGRVQKFNYFNGTKLDELAQYSLRGRLGLNLTILPGDDGTDYEPYVTKYYIESIGLDWKNILYPIRIKLKSVMATVAQLEDLKDVYNVHNWDCVFNTSTHDATFTHAKLQWRVLEQVNEVIKNNLK